MDDSSIDGGYKIADDLDSLAADAVRELLAALQLAARPNGTWEPDTGIEVVTQWFASHGFPITADTESSSSRQHYIDTGAFLPRHAGRPFPTSAPNSPRRTASSNTLPAARSDV